MKNPSKLLVTVAVSAGLLAGSIAASAPAQAAGPTYYGGGSMTIGPCQTQQQQMASNRNYRIIKSCFYTATSTSWGIPGYYFAYQAAY